jgi:hypothetical protein
MDLGANMIRKSNQMDVDVNDEISFKTFIGHELGSTVILIKYAIKIQD